MMKLINMGHHRLMRGLHCQAGLAAFFALAMVGDIGGAAEKNAAENKITLIKQFGGAAGWPPEFAVTDKATQFLRVWDGGVRVKGSGLFPSGSSFSVCLWFVPSSKLSDYQFLLFKGNRRVNPAKVSLNLSLYDGRPQFGFMDANGDWQGILRRNDKMMIPGMPPEPVKTFPAVNPEAWNFLSATFDRGFMRLFLNGRFIAEGKHSLVSIPENIEPVVIGAGESGDGGPAYFFDGMTDDIRFYSGALCADDLGGIYEEGRTIRPESEKIEVKKPFRSDYDPDFKRKLRIVEKYETEPQKINFAGGSSDHCSVGDAGGVPVLTINGKPEYPMCMMPCPWDSNGAIFKSCRDFAAAGVDFYSEILWPWKSRDNCAGWWLGRCQYDFKIVEDRLDAIIRANPKARIIVRIKMDANAWWLKENPTDRVETGQGKKLTQPSLASRKWRGDSLQMLSDVVGHLEASDYAKHIIGYLPAGGSSSEWYWWGCGEDGGVDYSGEALTAFREWLRKKYQDEKSLRLAWRDNSVKFETASVPSPQSRKKTENLFFRDPVAAAAVIDYREFLSDITSGMIIDSCHAVKRASGGKKLTGAFYGYSTHIYGAGKNHDNLGFQGLDKILKSNDVDFLCGPTAYDHRRGGEPGVHISAYSASYRLHKKLYWDEADMRTYLCDDMTGCRTPTLEETLQVNRRAFGYSLCKGTNIWWFLLVGNASFHQNDIMNDIAKMSQIGRENICADKRSAAQVAVFCDERGMHYNNGQNKFFKSLVRETVDELARVGAPSDFYLMSDLGDPRLPEYKVYIFMNAFYADDNFRQLVGRIVKRAGKTAVWVYAPGYLSPAGIDVNGIKDLTGINTAVVNEECVLSLELISAPHPVTAFLAQSSETFKVGPVFYVDDPDARILGVCGGKASLAIKSVSGWNSVYSLLPLNAALIKGICDFAGVHVYSRTFDVFSANKSFIMLHCSSDGQKTISLPGKYDVTELLSGQEIGKGLTEFSENLKEMDTRIYKLTSEESRK